MDLDQTKEFIDEVLIEIVGNLRYKKISKIQAVEQLENLLNGILEQLRYSELTATEKAEFKDIKLLLRIAISEIENSNF